MARYEYIRQAVKGNANNSTWAVSQPDRWERVQLQLTCQGIVLESDLTPIQDVATVKAGMERMLKELLTNKATSKIIIRRKAA